MQKFTRPLTREIEVAGERLALTFNEQGMAVRPVGSRKPPWEMTWSALVHHLTASSASPPSSDEVTAALGKLKGGSKSRPATPPSPAAEKSTPAPSAPAQTADASHSLTALLKRLDHALAAHRPAFSKALLPGASPAELEALQTAIGVPLPEELKTLLSWHNGQDTDFVGRFEQDWSLMSTAVIAAAKHELDGGGAAQGGWQRAWIPFLDDDAGDYTCLDTSQHGNPVRAFWLGQTDHPIVASSLGAWLEDFVSALERGEYHEDPERGTFLRSGKR